jgi:hypothetical protein
MKEIILTVDIDGKTKLETKGFKGKACMQASKFLEDALGKVTDTELTPAYYEFDGQRMGESLKKFVNQK